MSFLLPLRENRVKPHQITALHLILALSFTATGAVFYWIYDLMIWGAGLMVIGGLLLIVSLFANRWLISPSINRNIRLGELLVALCVLSYTVIQQMYFPAIMYALFGGALLFALLWEGNKASKQVIHITIDKIKLPVTSRRKNIEWYEIEKVILKYGTLTVNCVDGRMFQWTIGNYDFNDEAFQEFCELQVNEAMKDRRKNNW